MAVVDDVFQSHHERPLTERVAGIARANWVNRYVRVALAVDFASAFFAGLVALFGRFPGLKETYVLPYQLITLALPFVWISAVAVARGYEPRFIGVGPEEFRRVLNVGVTLTATVAVVAYASKTDVARGYVVVALPLATIADLVARYVLRKRLHRARGHGRCMRRVVAVGHRENVADAIRQFRSEQYHGMEIVAACLPPGERDTDIDGVPALGDFSDTALAVDWSGADTVAVLACPELDGVALRRLAWQLEKTGTDLCVAPALMDVAGPRTTIRPVAGLPLLHVEHPELTGTKQLVKSLVDRAGAACALVLLSPALLAIALVIRVTSHGPALFRQRRVGRHGDEFTMLKFRTMVVGAERGKRQLAAEGDSTGSNTVLFKLRNDPRVTPVGAWMRRYSLDELPQLINVLFGDMSLVGPRPPLAEEVAQYGYDVRRRLVVKPGMTGLWQVGGRSDLSWEESVRLDLRYVENWSLTLDLQILWKTISAVLRGSGAY